MSYLNIVCDSCGRGVQGITWVNGMKFCAKCYQETFGNNTKEITYVYGGNLKEHIKVIEEKDKRIADLEAKLADKDAEIRVVYSFRKQKCDNLQKALAEKERQVKKLNLEAQKYYEDAYCNDFHNQDKISFALEQLEKVKEILIQNADEIGEEYKEDYFMISLRNVKNIIDNQIASLKKGVE